MSNKDPSLWHWQYLVALVLIVMNVDWIVTPFLRNRGIAGWGLYWLVSLSGNLEIAIWFWWWLWFSGKALPVIVARKIERDKYLQKAVERGKEISQELKHDGYLEIFLNYLQELFRWATTNNIFKKIKVGSYLLIFLLGVEPWPGGRTVGIIFCALARWYRGTAVLILGNFFHAAYIVLGWDYGWAIFGAYWPWFLGGGLLLAGGGFLRKKLKKS